MLFQLRSVISPILTHPSPLHHPVPLSAAGRQRHRRREHDGNRRLNVPLQEVEDRVPPGPRQVVVGNLTWRLSRSTHKMNNKKLLEMKQLID